MGKILRRLLSTEDAIKNNKEIKLTDDLIEKMGITAEGYADAKQV